MSGPVRVLLVDDDPLVRSGLRLLMETTDDLRVVAEAGSGEEAVTAALAHAPDVALVDYRMGGMDGIEATARLTGLARAPRVVLLTTFDLGELPVRAVRAGACGFLLKVDPPLAILDGVREAAAGRAPLSSRSAAHVMDHLRSDGRLAREEAATARAATLSPREREVAVLVASGLTTAEAAARLHVAETTVKGALRSAEGKLGATSRAGLAIAVDRAGLLPDHPIG